MRYTLSILIVASLIINITSCSQNNPMTVREFTQKYFDSLRERFPNAKFLIVNDNTIQANVEDNQIQMSVDNAYREYKMDPNGLSAVLSRYLNAASELFASKNQLNIERIVPIIKPLDFLTEISNAAKQVNSNDSPNIVDVFEKYNDQLVIVYAEDTRNNIRYLTHDDVRTLAINQDSLRTIAVANLDRLLTSIQKKGGDGVYMVTAGGDYEASIILLQDVLNKENFQVDGDLVVAIPNRDMLLVTGSNDKPGIQKLIEISAKSYRTGNYPVSEYLYKWTGHAFEKFQ